MRWALHKLKELIFLLSISSFVSLLLMALAIVLVELVAVVTLGTERIIWSWFWRSWKHGVLTTI